MGGPFPSARKFIEDERGANLPEYALLLAFLVTVSLAAISSLGDAVIISFQRVTILLSGGGAGS